ncbi:MAG: hypothetical protein P1P88_16385 [Bacteroidales bacterium]|nr:hypothetical protein [Bacteroidales bacterium]
MKNIYTLVFSVNNLEEEENYLLNLNEVDKKEQLIKDLFDNVEFSPRKELVDNLFKFVREGKI